MNWTDAQSYCRKWYNDLATIGGSEDLKQFLDLISTAGYISEVWIGLYSEIDWRWSDGLRKSSPEYRNWETSDYDPDFISANQFCVCIGDNGGWWDYNCEKEFPFICYKGNVSVVKNKIDFEIKNVIRVNFLILLFLKLQRHHGGLSSWL